MRPKKGTSLIEFLPNSRYEHVASAHPSYDFYEIFRDCGISLLGHVLKFGGILSRGSRATWVLISGGPVSSRFLAPPSGETVRPMQFAGYR